MDTAAFALSLSELTILEEEGSNGFDDVAPAPGAGTGARGPPSPRQGGNPRVRKGYSGRSSRFLQDEVVMKQKLRGASGANLPKDEVTKSIHLLDPETPQARSQLSRTNEDGGDEDDAHPSLSGGDARRPRYWTPEEDATLTRAVQEHGEKQWKKISSIVRNRTSTQCIQRWKKVLKPGLKKGHWSPQEDALLLRGVKTQLEAPSKANGSASHGQRRINWSEVCKDIPNRSCKQCRERWVNHLNPDVNKGEWTPSEDSLLWHFQALTPRKWATIARNIPGRTENMVKVRWKILNRMRTQPGGEPGPADAGSIGSPLFHGQEADLEPHEFARGSSAEPGSAVKIESVAHASQFASQFAGGLAAKANELKHEIETEPLPGFFEAFAEDPVNGSAASADLKASLEDDFLPLDLADFSALDKADTPAATARPPSQVTYTTSFSSLQRTNSGGMGSFAAYSHGGPPSAQPWSFSTAGAHVLRSSSTEPSYLPNTVPHPGRYAGSFARANGAPPGSLPQQPQLRQPPLLSREFSNGEGGAGYSFSRSFKECQDLLQESTLLDSIATTFDDDEFNDVNLAHDLKKLYPDE